MESILETKAARILEFCAGLRGTLSVTFEEGTWAAWLYDLLKPHADKLVVCNPRKNALLKDGNKSDRVDARKLADLLRGNQLKPVYHGETGVRMLRELARSYLTIVKDLSRVMNRLKTGPISEAPDGETAIAVANSKRPDLVFLDIVMPGVAE
jgi:CheY-like chemotaxis protein